MEIWIGLILVAVAIALIIYANGSHKRSGGHSQPDEQSMPKQLSDGVTSSTTLPSVTGEKLEPDKAREWLDSFLQQQQQ